MGYRKHFGDLKILDVPCAGMPVEIELVSGDDPQPRMPVLECKGSKILIEQKLKAILKKSQLWVGGSTYQS